MTESSSFRRGRLLHAVLPLERPLATAHGPIEAREALVVELADDEGHVGWGEATPLPEFGTESFGPCRDRLEALLEGETSLAGGATPCADFAWSTALRDLEARRRNEKLVDRLAREAKDS